jgi:hypothetical protein
MRSRVKDRQSETPIYADSSDYTDQNFQGASAEAAAIGFS